MSSAYLKSLAERALGQTPVVRPQLPPLFAPGPVEPVAESPAETRWQDTAVTPPAVPPTSPGREPEERAPTSESPKTAASRSMPTASAPVIEEMDRGTLSADREPRLPLVEESIEVSPGPLVPPRVQAEAETFTLPDRPEHLPRRTDTPPAELPVQERRARRTPLPATVEPAPTPNQPIEIQAQRAAPLPPAHLLVPEYRPTPPARAESSSPVETDSVPVERPERQERAQTRATPPDRPLLVPTADPWPSRSVQPDERRIIPPETPPPAEAEPDTIQIHIGRIDVRATVQPKPETRKPQRPAPRLSLDDYLRAQNGRKS